MRTNELARAGAAGALPGRVPGTSPVWLPVRPCMRSASMMLQPPCSAGSSVGVKGPAWPPGASFLGVLQGRERWGGSHRASGLGSAPCPCHWRGGCGQEGDKTFLLPAPWRGGLPLQQAPGCFRQAAGCCWGKHPPNATSPQFRVARGWQGAPVAPQCCEHPVKALP